MGIARKIVIVARGDTEADLNAAEAEAMSKVAQGYTSGGDRNDTGGYYFDVASEVPASELPV